MLERVAETEADGQLVRDGEPVAVRVTETLKDGEPVTETEADREREPVAEPETVIEAELESETFPFKCLAGMAAGLGAAAGTLRATKQRRRETRAMG